MSRPCPNAWGPSSPRGDTHLRSVYASVTACSTRFATRTGSIDPDYFPCPGHPGPQLCGRCCDARPCGDGRFRSRSAREGLEDPRAGSPMQARRALGLASRGPLRPSQRGPVVGTRVALQPRQHSCGRRGGLTLATDPTAQETRRAPSPSPPRPSRHRSRSTATPSRSSCLRARECASRA